jgi:hypothetical protein
MYSRDESSLLQVRNKSRGTGYRKSEAVVFRGRHALEKLNY